MREPAYLSQRELAAAFPVAALVGAPAAAVPSASPHHPDAELLQLVDDLQDSEARREECDRQINDCFDRFEPPEIPDALIWRGSDFPSALRGRGRHSEPRSALDATTTLFRGCRTSRLSLRLRRDPRRTDTNPVVGTNKATDELPRDRVLADEELVAIWLCAGNGDYGRIIRLLILTGQRREEVGGLLWSEVERAQALWTIGAKRTKNGIANVVPLSQDSLQILAAQDQRMGRDLVFGSRTGPYQGWSNAKTALDVRMVQGAGRAITPWRLHDIRRTVATRLGDLGVLPHVVEAILNHVSGHRAGVAGVYNRATYAVEKRQALELWATRVAQLVQCEPPA